jgi:hypothetical protein
MLDEVRFGLIKRFKNKWTFSGLSSQESNEIIKMLNGWIQATTPNLNKSDFKAAGKVEYKKKGKI